MNSPGVEFRSYTDADLELLPELFLRAIQVADPRLEDGEWIDDLRDPESTYGQGGDIIVGVEGAEVIAMGGLKRVSETTAEMKRVGVEPTRQGQGIGSQLLAALENRARELGVTKIVLDTPHEVAKGMYENSGYVEVGLETIDHPSGQTYTVFFFEKLLQ